MPPLLISDITFLELSADSPALQSFTCEEAELCDFLAEDALSDSENCYSKTHLLLHNGAVIGYFSLVSDTVTLSHAKDTPMALEYYLRYGFRRGNKKRDTIPMYLDFLPIRNYFRSENV